MKDWCEHRFGYVNFDDEFLYFSSTGNWSDVKNLGEFREETSRKSSSSEQYKTISYLGVLSVLLICLLWWLGMDTLSFGGITGLLWLGYAGYHYMAKGLTGEFKIPYSKIQSIDINDQSVDIRFVDFNGKEEHQHLQKLRAKGIHLFSVISNDHFSNTSKDQKTDRKNLEI